MHKLNGIIINGEYLGNSVVINGMFRTICTISPAIMRYFIAIVNNISELSNAVVITNFNCYPNSINIDFKNGDSIGSASLFFELSGSKLELTDYKVVLNEEEFALDETVENISDESLEVAVSEENPKKDIEMKVKDVEILPDEGDQLNIEKSEEKEECSDNIIKDENENVESSKEENFLESENEIKEASGEEGLSQEETEKMLKEAVEDDGENSSDEDNLEHKKYTIIAKNIKIEISATDKDDDTFVVSESSTEYVTPPQSDAGNQVYKNGFNYNCPELSGDFDYEPKEGGFNITPNYGRENQNYIGSRQWSSMPQQNYGMPNEYAQNMPKSYVSNTSYVNNPQSYAQNFEMQQDEDIPINPLMFDEQETSNLIYKKRKKPLMTLKEFRARQKRIEEAREKQRRQKIHILGSRENVNANALQGGLFVAGNKVYKWGEIRVLEK